MPDKKVRMEREKYMKKFSKLLDRLRGLTGAVARYPLTTAFLLAAAVITAVSIHTEKDHAKELLACAVGAVLCAALQQAHTRFFVRTSSRLMLMGGGLALTLGYYLIILPVPDNSIQVEIRTLVALLALFFAFIWLPVIQSRVSFNESFMAAFKAFFHSLFYAAVLFAGCSLIFGAIDLLIANISSKAYLHTSNVVFVLFAPLFFLSLIPEYPGEKDKAQSAEKTAQQAEAVVRAADCPKFLEALISYIIIPITAVFTVILLIYIVLNIKGEFWSNNLLEPMLVSYAVAVILLYILSSRLENKFASLFRLIFPKVLVPIVLFQIAASVVSIRDTGITHTRYFVILFGVFAAAAGVVMSLVPVRKNGILAAMLIAFSAVSVIPPVDAFTVSRISQENMLTAALVRNGMLENNVVTPNANVSDTDKKKIVLSLEYLDRMKYTGKIEWLPENFSVYEDFYDTFGFRQYDLPEDTYRPVNVFLNSEQPLDIAGYDILARAYLSAGDTQNSKICDLSKSGKSYQLKKEKTGGQYDIVLTDETGAEVIRFDTGEVFSRYSAYATEKTEISMDEALFTLENDRAGLALIVQNANIDRAAAQTGYYADVYILIRIK